MIKDRGEKAVVVYISGFMTPANIVCFPPDMVPEEIRMISVYPSPVGSIHDRICQIFYELKGGTVDYGHAHSHFHGHNRFGKHYVGKYPQWDENHPIYLVGHSLGGVTAWAVHNYLAKGRFEGFQTSASWVTGIITVNAPLNGALQVYNKGMDIHLPALLQWFSPGHFVGMFAQNIEYFNLPKIRYYFNPELEHWNLSHDHPHSWKRWLLSIVGYGVYSTSDHIAYDASLHSQLSWHKYNTIFPETYYCSIVGNLTTPSQIPKGKGSFLQGIVSCMYEYTRSHPPTSVGGMDTSHWSRKGHDGLLSIHTQEFPRLIQTPDIIHGLTKECFHRTDLKLMKGAWYHYQVLSNHLTVALQGRHVWQEIFNTVLKMHQHHFAELNERLLHNQHIQVHVKANPLKSRIASKRTIIDESELGNFTIMSTTCSTATMSSSNCSINSSSSPVVPDVTPDMQKIELNLQRCHVPNTNVVWKPLGKIMLPIVTVQLVEVLFAFVRMMLLMFGLSQYSLPLSDALVGSMLLESLLLFALGPQWVNFTLPRIKLCLFTLLWFARCIYVHNTINHQTIELFLAFLGIVPFAPSLCWLATNLKERSIKWNPLIRFKRFRRDGDDCIRTQDKLYLQFSLDLVEIIAIVTGLFQWGLTLSILICWWKLSVALVLSHHLCVSIVWSLTMARLLMALLGTKHNDLFRAMQFNLIKLQGQMQDLRLNRVPRWTSNW